MAEPRNLFATAPKGLEPLLADELRALGANDVKETRAGVAFSGGLATAYRVCLWSRLANRVLLPLATFPAPTPEALYAGVQTVNWSRELSPDGTLAVDANVSGSAITHSQFAALKVKDAVVDQLRAASGRRPSVDTERPDLRINLYLLRDEATLSLDLSGESLHRRGYRAEGGEAPLKENLAAAILLRAGWPEIAQAGGALVDPMCGSGTLTLEAALMAGDIAPGLGRTYYGFLRWRGHDHAAWEALLAEARERRRQGLERLRALAIRGYDRDAAVVRIARGNAKRAGLAELVRFEQRALAACEAEESGSGLVVVNPPYGERLGGQAELPSLYSSLGAALKKCYPGWRAAVFTGNPELGRLLDLRAHKLHTLYNGAIECRLLHFELPLAESAPAPRTEGAEAFANRLHKNLRHLGRWARREGISCYRLYDADLHEYNFAIDIYDSERRYVHVQEYQAPASIDPRRAQRRLADALAAIPAILEITPEQMFYKRRQRQKGGTQYEKLASRGTFHEVREGPCRLLVNFTDYLDTGLFLDHRPTRAMLGELAKGKRFLNLFCYTGTATVHAALGGATSTTSVDMSRTYLDWAQRNLGLNGIRGRHHELVQADVLQWLEERHRTRYADRSEARAARQGWRGGGFGLIFLDPPSFSRSKRMEETLDVQRDHVALIQSAARLLEPDGVFVFSTNLRKFKLDKEALAGFDIRDITRATIPKDFEREPRIHQCFRLTLKNP
jgi:23S rRNA (guanine2445-N2)-methyltransferase / 23S rRNA (guanine2069-N7)-methyltransferase